MTSTCARAASDIGNDLSEDAHLAAMAARLARQSVRMSGVAAPQELVETALRAADAAAHQLLLRADHPWSGVGSKSSATDLVGDADRAAERAIARDPRS